MCLDELFHLGQQFHLVPGIACREHQIKKHIGVGLARHDARRSCSESAGPLTQLSVRRLRSFPRRRPR